MIYIHIYNVRIYVLHYLYNFFTQYIHITLFLSTGHVYIYNIRHRHIYIYILLCYIIYYFIYICMFIDICTGHILDKARAEALAEKAGKPSSPGIYYVYNDLHLRILMHII